MISALTASIEQQQAKATAVRVEAFAMMQAEIEALRKDLAQSNAENETLRGLLRVAIASMVETARVSR